MKKFVVLFIAVSMVFLFSVSASAESKVYFDYLLSGEYDLSADFLGDTNPALSADLTFLTFGGETLLNKIMLGFDYTTGSSNDSTTNGWTLIGQDITSYNLKIGYRIVDSEKFKFDPVIAISNFSSKSKATGTEMDIDSTLLGLEGTFTPTEQIAIDIFYDFSLSASAKAVTKFPGDVSVTNYGVKFYYFFDKNVAGTLGYRNLQGSLKYMGTKGDYTLSGFSFGVAYKF